MAFLVRCSAVLIAAISLGANSGSFAQDRYPSKPIRLIEPIPAGSVTDVVFRMAGQEVMNRMGQPLVMEVRPGANMILAAETCAKATPDGYTMCVLSNDIVSYNPNMFSKLPYDPEKDFRPLIRGFYLVSGLLTPASLPVKTAGELQAMAVSKPGTLNFGTHGPNSATDIFRQLLGEKWKTSFVGIPYKGGALIINALLGQEIQVAWIGVGNLGGQLKSGKVKVLAVSGKSRSPLLPQVPTADELGFPEFPAPWFGLGLPAGTPDAIVNRLGSELVQIFRDRKVVDYMQSQFLEPALVHGEEFAAFMRADRERVGALFKRFNVPQQ